MAVTVGIGPDRFGLESPPPAAARTPTLVLCRSPRPGASTHGAVRPARADVRPLRPAALLRPGPALAPLPRLAHPGRPRATPSSTSRPARAPSRLELVRQTGCSVVGLDQSPEMLAVARRRVPAGCELVEGEADDLPFPDALVRRPHVHLPAPLRRRPGRDPARARPGRPARRDDRRARVRRARRSCSRGSLWRLYTRAGLPLAGRLISPGWHEVGDVPRTEHRGALAPPAARTAARRCGGTRGIDDVRFRRLSLGGGIVIWGTAAHERRGPAGRSTRSRRAAGATT